MYDYAAVERELGKRNYFPNVGEDAYFDPQSLTIHLNRITAAGFADALRRQDLSTLRIQFGTMLHEITHWADLVGTLWGREYLRTVYAALRLMPTTSISGSEHEFHRFVDLHDRTRRMMMSRYFRVVRPSPKPHDYRYPWRLQLSAGREFDPWGQLNDRRPVIFARFDDHSQDEQIARQPIVAGALLEVNAVWSELRTNGALLAEMPEIDRLIETKQFRADRLAQLYNPELTIYTAPAHLLAMTLKTTDINTAYHLASSVAHVVLNLRDEDFDNLTPPDGMKPWENLFAGFRASRDRGFAYAAICQSASQWTAGRLASEWLDEALARVKLGSASSIYATARERMQKDIVVDDSDLLGRAERYVLSLGPGILAMRSVGDTALTPGRVAAERAPVPPMFDHDGRLIDLSSGAFDRSLFPLEELHQRVASLHTWTQNFLGACR